jgi:hypothetical protein
MLIPQKLKSLLRRDQHQRRTGDRKKWGGSEERWTLRLRQDFDPLESRHLGGGWHESAME